MLPRLFLLGLGNPGPRYALTRHNLGLRVVDRMAAGRRVGRWEGGQTCVRAEFELESTHVILVKPRTYMNLSGRAAVELRSVFGVEPGELLVAVDDIALPLGQLRLRRRGSDGGHNGLKSVIAELGTMDFPRLRMGVGAVPPGVDAADFVLSPFFDEETEEVDAMIDRAVQCVESVVQSGFDRAMGVFNTSDTTSDTSDTSGNTPGETG
jgi:PTH1 family peptidyl-tRNA hydrolase